MSAPDVLFTPLRADDWEELVRFWEETAGPEGCKVEIIEGIVTVAPPPADRHIIIAEAVQRQLYAVLSGELGLYRTQSVAVPSRTGMFIPDLLVLPRDLLSGPGSFVSPAAAELVVEVTSPSNARHDRVAKCLGYAKAGVPLYLLIDAFAPLGPTLTLHTEPRDGLYRVLRVGTFGEPFPLPAPFGLELDTSGFLAD
ncbi:Uma2 family endonuclease [Streptomyces sp. NPDC051567]|uniref:Uma2 family endonuclease n=1 Tax=Streptomyces sp. NPDC051567 TaxID=3365660 RepID=UPI0037A5AA8D